MKLYTRRGDGGETDLFAGGRISKDHPRVEAYGAVDELNAQLGVCAAATEHADLRRIAEHAQGLLFDLGAYLATPDPQRRERSGVSGPQAADVDELELHIDELERELPPLRRFVLPGGCAAAATFHVARTACRRAERRTVRLHRDEAVGEDALRYLNRLSDLLFVLARVENQRAGIPDAEWGGRA